MAGMHEAIDGIGEIPAELRTPLVEKLLRVIEQQQREIARLQAEIERLTAPKPPRQPSSLGEATPPNGSDGKKRKKKRRRGKRPGSEKRKKTRELRIDKDEVLKPQDLPEDAGFEGYKDFVVQDLVLYSENIRYRRARYRLPDGNYLTGQLPGHVTGHFGAGLRSYVLYQHYQNHVTQPLILEQLRDLGVDISGGQVNRILTEGHEAFHEEKASLFPAAREVSQWFHVDDTPAGPRRGSGHTTHVGNDFFASFTTTDSKSRINFFKILREPYDDYIVGDDAFFYMEWHGLPQWLLAQLRTQVDENEGLIVHGDEAWEEQLDHWKISSQDHRRIVTEGALFSCLVYHELYVDQALISDDAGQFKVLGVLHGLCWYHAERRVASLVPEGTRQRQALERVETQIWRYYQRLKAYRESPSDRKKAALERDFDRLFLQRTGWKALNEALHRLHDKKDLLLVVLEHPHLPLTNNLSERDIRDFAKKRKISAGARSGLGRRNRDTFLSLKKTCRKLGVSFWRYLRDRIFGTGKIPSLADLILRAAAPDC